VAEEAAEREQDDLAALEEYLAEEAEKEKKNEDEKM